MADYLISKKRTNYKKGPPNKIWNFHYNKYSYENKVNSVIALLTKTKYPLSRIVESYGRHI